MSKALLLLELLLIPIAFAFAAAPLNGGEAYRIRIENKPGGLVQVSSDCGYTYGTVGRVKTAANARITGFGAASYAPQGTVCAVAVHGIRIKTGQSAEGVEKAQIPLIFSITPRQFADIPSGYGGHRPRSSGIITDIDAGSAIFRNLAPLVGSRVFIERNRGLSPLPEDYIPVGGETFVITVTRPDEAPSEVTFENRVGGKVTASYPDGSTKVITEVVRPVRGVGRYDGTTFTGVGAINTNHPGVITISTAPVCPPETKEGGPKETRGGFMIQPYFHACELGDASPQVMVVGPKDRSKPALEGVPPLFSGCIGLSWYPNRPGSSYRAQVRFDDGEWRDPPSVIGKVDNALEKATAVRLLFPKHDARLTAAEIRRESEACAARSAAGMKPVKGRLRFSPSKPPRGGCLVTLYVDGRAVSASSRYPYSCEWDSASGPNGLHSVEIECSQVSGNPSVERHLVLVRNQTSSGSGRG
jgi:hypothetical protein